MIAPDSRTGLKACSKKKPQTLKGCLYLLLLISLYNIQYISKRVENEGLLHLQCTIYAFQMDTTCSRVPIKSSHIRIQMENGY